jgi:hypothetical protein
MCKEATTLLCQQQLIFNSLSIMKQPDKPMQLLEHQKLKCSRSSGHSWHHSSEGQELACSMVWNF